MIREPAVSGMFYPADEKALRRAVNSYIEAARDSGLNPKAIIAPHAGYVYSGPVAGFAYRPLTKLRGKIRRVVLLGPSHRVAFSGTAVTGASAYRTPAGDVAVDREALTSIGDLPDVNLLEAAHRDEHSLEVHLPFLQEALGDFALVPLVVGDIGPEAMADVLERLWGGPETLIVVSSDLSHYLDYETARARDRRTEDAVLNLAPGRIGPGDACGCRPVGGLLATARRRGLGAVTADLRNSGDTAGSKDRVVGYGSWLFAQAGVS